MRLSKWSGALWPLAVVLLAGSLFVGCGGDDGGGGGPDLIVIGDFEGVWAATSRKVTSATNPQISLDLVTLGGALSWDVDDTGQFTGRAFVPEVLTGVSIELPSQGHFELISQDSLKVVFTPEVPPFLKSARVEFTLVGDTFTVLDENSMFDFDGDQVPEPAIVEGTLVKNDGSIPPVVFVSDFEGFWEATTYRVTSVANPLITMEAISLGATFEFDCDETGQVVGDAFIPAAIAGQDVVISDFGAYYYLATQDTINIVFTPEAPPFLTNTRGAFTFVADTLNITDTDASFDFDGDQVEEPAIFEATMERTAP
jgi:hypothetical protein